MKVKELIKRLEEFQKKLIEHQTLYNSSFPVYTGGMHPVRNIDELQKQSHWLYRWWGENQSILNQFRDSTGDEGDYVNYAIGLDAIAPIKTQFFKKIIAEINRIIGRLTDMNPNIELNDDLHISKNEIKPYDQLSKSITQANSNITKIYDSLRSPTELLGKRIQEQQIQWTNALKPVLSATERISSLGQAFQNQFTEITKLSNLSQQVFERLQWKDLGSLLELKTSVQDQLKTPFIDMGKSYNSLWKALEINPISVVNFSPIMIQQPSTDFYFATRLSYLITEQQPSVSKDEETFLETNHQRTNSFLCELLPQLDPTLLVLYQGAITSLDSNNPDKQRHVAVSLRELFTQILHALSPDDKFKEWNSDPNNLRDGRPTRKGRLLYIYRNINFPPFNQFIKKDVEAALSFLDLFQKGTHKIKGPFSGQQSRAILNRMESLLYFIIKTNLN